MNLRSLSDQELLQSTKRAVDREREAITEVLHHLREIDQRKIFGVHSSLYQFAMKEYGYSEGEANARVTASRLLKQVPEIEAKMESGSLTLTHLVKASAFFAQEKKAKKPLAPTEKLQVLELLEGKSIRDGERVLFSLSSNPMSLKERTLQASATHTEITFFANDETMAKLKRVKEIWAHSLPAPTWEELISRMADVVIEKQDPLKKAERAIVRKDKALAQAQTPWHQSKKESIRSEGSGQSEQKLMTNTMADLCRSASLSSEARHEASASDDSVGEASSCTTQREATRPKQWPVTRPTQRPKQRPKQRPAIPASVEHQVRVRDEDRCTFIGTNGERCESRHGLQFDHIQPYAMGGPDTFENLRLRCKAHNLRHAIEVYGAINPAAFVHMTK